MGNSLSTGTTQTTSGDVIRQSVHTCLSPFERMSLKKHAAAIGGDFDALLAELGVVDAPGSGVLLRMANIFTENDLMRRLGLAVCWLDGRLAREVGISESEWRQRVFEAAAIAEVGGEPYMPFQDLLDLVNLILSAFDLDPRDQSLPKVDILDPSGAAKLLDSMKAPAVRYEQFGALFDRLPYLLAPLANIWDRLLYDSQSTELSAPNPRVNASLQRSHEALLFAVQGPRIFEAMRLFQGTTNGFSMRALEVGVTKWPSSTILLVTGHQPRNFTKWDAKPKDVDRLIPRVFDTPILAAKKVVFALVVDEPWKSSYKHCIGKRPVLLQLEPEFRSWALPPSTVFMVPTIGFGAGFPRPPTEHERVKGAVLLVDSYMEHGIMRSVPETNLSGERFEYRFYIDQVEVLGCGSQQDLEKQKNAWAWEDAEATRRRTINVQEDRALLEMAGLVGQYHH